jgi:hypothetical protein
MICIYIVLLVDFIGRRKICIKRFRLLIKLHQDTNLKDEKYEAKEKSYFCERAKWKIAN